jgi:hypothetical protein
MASFIGGRNQSNGKKLLTHRIMLGCIKYTSPMEGIFDITLLIDIPISESNDTEVIHP